MLNNGNLGCCYAHSEPAEYSNIVEEENTAIESRAKRERSIILVNISHVATSRELKRTLWMSNAAAAVVVVLSDECVQAGSSPR